MTKFIEKHVQFVAKELELLTLKEIYEEGKKDEELNMVVSAIENGWDGAESKNLTRWQYIRTELSYAQGILWSGRRVFVLQNLRKKALALAHEAHQGIVRTKQRLRATVFWPGMDADAEEFCRNYETRIRLRPLKRDTPLQSTPLPEQCWDKCSVDLVGPFPEQRYILTLVDYRSKWPEASILTNITSKDIIKCLTESFACFGNPKTIVSDNGRQFISKEFELFLKSNGIKHVCASPYYPQANGQVERFHRYLKHSLRAADIDGIMWMEALPGILQIYRSTPHAGTGMSQAKLMLNREITTKLSAVQAEEIELEERYQGYQERMKDYADEKRRAEQHELEIGDVVFMANMSDAKLKARGRLFEGRLA